VQINDAVIRFENFQFFDRNERIMKKSNQIDDNMGNSIWCIRGTLGQDEKEPCKATKVSAKQVWQTYNTILYFDLNGP
jgi:hypothetical protein